jgi:hypothetical protein
VDSVHSMNAKQNQIIDAFRELTVGDMDGMVGELLLRKNVNVLIMMRALTEACMYRAHSLCDDGADRDHACDGDDMCSN